MQIGRGTRSGTVREVESGDEEAGKSPMVIFENTETNKTYRHRPSLLERQ
jgi:hypothetical protein